MCAMTRQPVQARLAFVLTCGVAVAACGLDRQGTEFTAEGSESRPDGGLAVAQGRPDAASKGEDSAEVRQAVGGGIDPGPAVLALSEAGSPPQAELAEDAGSGPQASFDAPVFSDAAAAAEGDVASPDATPPTTGSSCDQDGDGHLAAGAPCFGDDCCDTDPNAYPGQTAYFSTPSQCGGFDYDCDGASTPQYGLANCAWAGLGCAGDGFVAAAACGATAPFSVCASTGLLTCAASVGSLTQACR
jgi:hypothetical protein